MQPTIDRGLRGESGECAPVNQRLAPCLNRGRDFFGNRYVYLVFSPRGGGLTVGVNLNPDRKCNFDCVYCEVNRSRVPAAPPFDPDIMASELLDVLGRLHSGRLAEELPWLRALPQDLLRLNHVALSGEGEPTLCPSFAEAVQAVVHIRARKLVPFFKIVLLTNAALLHEPHVQAGLKFLIQTDELWLKLDVGTRAAFERINRPRGVDFSTVLANLRSVGRHRPIVIQSLFPMIDGVEPSDAEIQAYCSRLVELSEAGAQISQVQVYSAARPTTRSECRHLPLKSLSRIALRVRQGTGLPVEVY